MGGTAAVRNNQPQRRPLLLRKPHTRHLSTSRWKVIIIIVLPTERLDASMISLYVNNIPLHALVYVQLLLGDRLLERPPQRLEVTHSSAGSVAQVVVLGHLLLESTQWLLVNMGQPRLRVPPGYTAAMAESVLLRLRQRRDLVRLRCRSDCATGVRVGAASLPTVTVEWRVAGRSRVRSSAWGVGCDRSVQGSRRCSLTTNRYGEGWIARRSEGTIICMAVGCGRFVVDDFKENMFLSGDHDNSLENRLA